MNTEKLKDWHPADIKSELSKRGYTLRNVTHKYGLPEQTCSSAFSGASRQGDDAITTALGFETAANGTLRFEKMLCHSLKALNE